MKVRNLWQDGKWKWFLFDVGLLMALMAIIVLLGCYI